MYEAFYGFKEKPFSMLPDPGFLYLSKKHQAALTLLEYGLLNHVGFCVISGEAGAGKTTILRTLLERVEDDVTVGLITNTHQSFGGLLDWVLSAFDLHRPNLTHVEMHQIFMDYLIEEYANGRTVLLIVDEAQNMKPDALEELRMLSNVNSEKDQLMQVVLSGQPALKETLRMPDLMQFAQRIAVDYHLGTLNLEETCGYIQHRLITAGSGKDVFTPAACERIHNYSGGTPRLINLLCETVLVYGFADQQELIDVDLVDEMVLERMKDSVVPIVNRDIAKKSNKKESVKLEKDFPHIMPQSSEDEQELAEETQSDEISEEVRQIIQEYGRSDVIDVVENKTTTKAESKTAAKSEAKSETSGREKSESSGSGGRGKGTDKSRKSATSASKDDAVAPAATSGKAGNDDAQSNDGANGETGKQIIQYGIKAAAVAAVLVVFAVLLNDDSDAPVSTMATDEASEGQLQREEERQQDSKRMRDLQVEAETLKKERDAAIAKADEERKSKALAEKQAAKKAIAAAAAAEVKRKAADKKRIAASKERERKAKKAEAKAKAEAELAKQKTLELEKERLFMQTQLDEQRRLKEQEEARRRVLEYEETLRVQQAAEAAKKSTEAAATPKAKKSVDCSGPTARFKASCRR